VRILPNYELVLITIGFNEASGSPVAFSLGNDTAPRLGPVQDGRNRTGTRMGFVHDYIVSYSASRLRLRDGVYPNF
jgi:hypothetical protein